MDLLVTSPWIPIEWIRAHGFAPRGAWAPGGHAPVDSTEGVCAFAKTAQQLRQLRPETPAVFTTACDQMRRAADAAETEAPSGDVFLFNLPATWQTQAARELYHVEVQRLGRFLRRHGGCTPTATALNAVMREHDQWRSRLRAWSEYATARQTAEAMTGYFNGDPLPDEVAPQPHTGVPLALVGGPLCASQWGLFDTIEAVGGRVVLNGTEPGERCLLPPLPGDVPAHCGTAATKRPGTRTKDMHEDDGMRCGWQRFPEAGIDSEVAATPADGDVLDVLCDHYFDHLVDVFQRPNSRLYDWLGTRLDARNVRGIVLWVHVGCDLWRAEAASLREAFGLPVLVLDSPDLRCGSLRDANRLAAFVESLR